MALYSTTIFFLFINIYSCLCIILFHLLWDWPITKRKELAIGSSNLINTKARRSTVVSNELILRSNALLLFFLKQIFNYRWENKNFILAKKTFGSKSSMLCKIKYYTMFEKYSVSSTNSLALNNQLGIRQHEDKFVCGTCLCVRVYYLGWGSTTLLHIVFFFFLNTYT